MDVVDSEIGGARLACLWAPGDPASVMWRTKAADGETESLVYVSGWCYSLDRPGTTLTSQDFLEALDRHRRRLPPLGDRFSGNYVAVVFDRSCHRIAVQPDWSAMTGAYYGVADGTIAVSDRASSIAGLLAADIDGHSFLSLVEGIHPPFGRTLFSGVHRVLCGCYLEIDTHTAHCAVRRSAPLVPSTVPRTMDAAVSEMTQVMATVAGRILDSPRTVLDLTGGNDTRLIAAAIAHRSTGALPPELMWDVAGGDDDPDVLVAQRLAAMCGWPLLRLPRHDRVDVPLDELEAAAVLADGSELAWAALARIDQETQVRAAWNWLVGANGGELLRGFFWRHELLSPMKVRTVNYASLFEYRIIDGRLFDSVRRALASAGVPMSRLTPGGPAGTEQREAVLEPYRQIGRLGQGRLKPYLLDVMYLHKMCYAAGSSLSWLTGVQGVRYPLLTSEVAGLALSFPWTVKAGRGLMLRVIEQLSPALARVPTDGGDPMQPLQWTTLPRYLSAWGRFGAHTIPRIVNKYRRRPGSGGQSRERVTGVRPRDFDGLRHVQSAVDPGLIQLADHNASTPGTDRGWRHLYHVLLTLELLWRGVPGLTRRISFGSGPSIVP